MKTVFSNQELPHIWASQTQQGGRGHSFYFSGKDIFSYGDHFCIARIADNKHVFITSRTYSKSTSKHKYYTRNAVSHFTQISVPYPNADLFESVERGDSNAKYWLAALTKQLADADNKRKRPETREGAKANAIAIVQKIEKYMALTDQTLATKTKDTDTEHTRKLLIATCEQALGNMSRGAVEELIKHTALNEKRAETRKQNEAKRKMLAKVPAWIKGKENSNAIYGLSKIYLRVSVGTVETSHGARVSMRAAKILFDRIQKGKDVVGFDLDGYIVVSINGVLKIGCHDIERSEIERFAKSQKWI